MRFIFRWLSRSKDRLHNVWNGCFCFPNYVCVTTLHFCYGQPLLSARRMNYQSKCHSSVGQAGNVDKIFFYISFHVLIRSLTPLENTSNLLGYYRYIFGTIKRTILNMIDQPFKKKLIFKDISKGQEYPDFCHHGTFVSFPDYTATSSGTSGNGPEGPENSV